MNSIRPAFTAGYVRTLQETARVAKIESDINEMAETIKTVCSTDRTSITIHKDNLSVTTKDWLISRGFSVKLCLDKPLTPEQMREGKPIPYNSYKISWKDIQNA